MRRIRMKKSRKYEQDKLQAAINASARRALDDLEKNGLTAVDKVGRSTVNPAFNIQRSAMANIIALMKELSISARQRRLLTSAGQTEEVDPMDEFLQKINND